MTKKGPYRNKPEQGAPRTLGERVAMIRKAWGWTQEELASRLRVRSATVSAWERCIATPNGISLIALASVLNTTPEALLGDEAFSVPPMLEEIAKPEWQNFHLPKPAEKDRVLLVTDGTASRSLSSTQLKKAAEDALNNGKDVWLVVN